MVGLAQDGTEYIEKVHEQTFPVSFHNFQLLANVCFFVVAVLEDSVDLFDLLLYSLLMVSCLLESRHIKQLPLQ